MIDYTSEEIQLDILPQKGQSLKQALQDTYQSFRAKGAGTQLNRILAIGVTDRGRAVNLDSRRIEKFEAAVRGFEVNIQKREEEKDENNYAEYLGIEDRILYEGEDNPILRELLYYLEYV